LGFAQAGAGVFVGVSVGISVGVSVGVFVSVGVSVGVLVGVSVGVAVSVGVIVKVAVGEIGVSVGRSVADGLVVAVGGTGVPVAHADNNNKLNSKMGFSPIRGRGCMVSFLLEYGVKIAKVIITKFLER
jgi:hypothetical protein